MTSGVIKQSRAGVGVGMTLGTIRLTKILGVGGQAAVYSGICSVSRERVAVKVLCDLRNLKRFRGEYRTLRQVNNPHVVRVHSYGATPVHHFVMDFLPGQSLEGYLAARGGKVPESEAIRLVLQLCDGLTALHNAGIVHRDINLRNAIVDPRGHLTVFDLGIAKRLPRFYDLLGSYTAPDLRAITTGTLGTPGFIAPETLFSGDSVTEQADIFALGVTLYVLITGERPKYMIELNSSSISEKTLEIIAFAIKFETSHRYSSVQTVAEDLAEQLMCLEHKPAAPEQPTKKPATLARKRVIWRVGGFLAGCSIAFILLALRLHFAGVPVGEPTNIANRAVMPTGDRPERATAPTGDRPDRATVPTGDTPERATVPTGNTPDRATVPTTAPTPTVPTPTVPTVSDTVVEKTADPRPKRSRKKSTAHQREFKAALQRVLLLCPVPPQTIRYRVGGGRVRLSFASPVDSTIKGCIRDALPHAGRFRGVFKVK